MPLLADEPTITQAPVTQFIAAVAEPEPDRDRRVLRAAILAGVVLLDVGLAAWALMSVKVALLVLRLHG